MLKNYTFTQRIFFIYEYIIQTYSVPNGFVELDCNGRNVIKIITNLYWKLI